MSFAMFVDLSTSNSRNDFDKTWYDTLNSVKPFCFWFSLVNFKDHFN